MDTLFKSGGLFLCRTPFPVGVWVGEPLRTAARPLFFFAESLTKEGKGDTISTSEKFIVVFSLAVKRFPPRRRLYG